MLISEIHSGVKERAWNKFDNYNAELLFQTG